MRRQDTDETSDRRSPRRGLECSLDGRGGAVTLVFAMRTVNPHSAEKLHAQLARLLREEIAAGRYAPGTNIPTENELCASHAVSKAVVRQAVGMLVAEGLVERRAGRGTRVLSTGPAAGVRMTLALGDPRLAASHPVEVHVESKKMVRVPAALRDFFPRSDALRLFELVRLFTLDGKPAALETSHVAETHCPGLAVLNLRGRGIPEVLEGHYGLRLARGTLRFALGAAEAEEARLLCLPPAAGVLVAVQRLCLADDAPVAHVRVVSAEGAPALTFELRRAAP
ncbi:GntR family transcriptional regulator [bacterium]|nr:GntR family transcriptional regulator [bacterium]